MTSTHTKTSKSKANSKPSMIQQLQQELDHIETQYSAPEVADALNKVREFLQKHG